MADKVELDQQTKEWFSTHPDVQCSVIKCAKCGLWYKPALGHKCTEKDAET